ncbi:hypothetical protein CKW47_21220, partial [Bordetella pertussis]
ALREARQRSSWTCPDLAYETLCARYLRALADDGRAVAARGRLAGQGPTRSQAAQQLDLSRPGLRNLVRALSARPGRRW